MGEKHRMDIIEARKDLGVVIVRMAAQRRTQEEIEELGALLANLKYAEPDYFLEFDIAFHLKLADMAKNSTLKEILSSILLHTRVNQADDGGKQISSLDYDAIYNAIAEGNQEAAAQAMETLIKDEMEVY
ncbi:FadR/GntR family transcriptional regulator [Paenibacillus piri]|nr:FCD domain-containing protein [Paenibacillus piri]